MTDKVKIRAAIEREMGDITYGAGKPKGVYDFCKELLSFIDSLPEEPTIDAEIVKDVHNLLHVKSGPLPMPSEHKFGDKV